jgi:hypothetical protein
MIIIIMHNHYHIRLRLHESDDDSALFVPTFLFQNLPAQKARPPRKTATHHHSRKDYRFGPIRIDWMDFEDTNKATYTGAGVKGGRGTLPSRHPPKRLAFTPFVQAQDQP